MTCITADIEEVTDNYSACLAGLEKECAAGERAWFIPARRQAFDRFRTLGFPTTRHEEWRYTNVASLAKTSFEPAVLHEEAVQSVLLDPFTFDGACHQLVFVNGRYAHSLSTVSSLPEGVDVTNMATALADRADLLEPHLGRHADYQDQAFTALNTALMEDGALITIADGVVLEAPIHLIFVTTDQGRATMSHPRNLIVLGSNSQATFVESYVSPGRGVYFTNTVMEIVAGEGAVVDHTKVVRESGEAFHFSALHIHQSRSSTVSSRTISHGGRLIRNDMNVVLDGEGCECTLGGFYMVSGTQQVDNHVVVDHAKPHCNSREFFKGILDGHGRGVFSGRIIVRLDAQKTDAKQTNMSLLLSDDAQVQSKPQLDILADDVKCTHGATVGQVDEEAVFYLRSRGLDEDAARSLMIYAFAKESLGAIPVEPLRVQLEELVRSRLTGGRLLGEGT